MPRERAPAPPPEEPRATGRGPVSARMLDVAEDLGSRFEELAGHVAARREYQEIAWEPSRPLPMVERRPGTLVWSRRAMVGAGGPSRGAPRGGQGFTVFYAVLPSSGETEDPREGDSPVIGLDWKAFAFAEPVRGEPRSLLLVRTDARRLDAVARSFAERLRTELEAEPD